MAGKPDMGVRLRTIAGLVPDGCRCLADIGTDHGYIPVSLLMEGKIRRAVAADIGKLPLDHARRTAGLAGVAADKLDFRLGDGLSVLSPGEADVIVIAGMGGDAIAAILEDAPCSRDGPLLLLQPMSRAEVLRRWLPVHGYRVSAERLVQDKGVIYPILTAQGGDMPPVTESRSWGGLLLEADPLWGLYLADRVLRLRRAAAGLSMARDPAAVQKRENLLQIVEDLERWKGEWERAHGTGDRARTL